MPFAINRSRKVLNTIFTIILCGAVVLIVITAILALAGMKKVSDYQLCMGTIIRFYENTSEMRLDSYETTAVSPVVEYFVNGQRYEFVANFYSTSMRTGDKVEVLYRADDHTDATLKKGVVFAPIITGSLAIVFVILSATYLIVKGKGLII